MKIVKKQDHVLFKNKDGEYHLSLDEFERLGEVKAKEFVKLGTTLGYPTTLL